MSALHAGDQIGMWEVQFPVHLGMGSMYHCQHRDIASSQALVKVLSPGDDPEAHLEGMTRKFLPEDRG